MNLLQREANKYSANTQARRANKKNRCCAESGNEQVPQRVLKDICWAMCCCRFEHLQATSTDRERKEKSNSAFMFCMFVSAPRRETVARTQTHVANMMILSPLIDVAFEPWRRKLRNVLHSWYRFRALFVCIIAHAALRNALFVPDFYTTAIFTSTRIGPIGRSIDSGRSRQGARLK